MTPFQTIQTCLSYIIFNHSLIDFLNSRRIETFRYFFIKNCSLQLAGTWLLFRIDFICLLCLFDLSHAHSRNRCTKGILLTHEFGKFELQKIGRAEGLSIQCFWQFLNYNVTKKEFTSYGLDKNFIKMTRSSFKNFAIKKFFSEV